MRQPVEVEVERPREFWHVTVDDRFVSTDPSTEGGPVYTYDSGEPNWGLIATMMRDISDQLKSAPFDRAVIRFDLPESRADAEVILSWFGGGDPIVGDPGNVESGRRRLWETFLAQPGAVLPVRSATRSQARVLGEPTVGQVNAVLSNIDERGWKLNTHLRPWFEERRG